MLTYFLLGFSLILKFPETNKNLELVFENIGAAQQFCIWVCKSAKKKNNVLIFASSMQWDDVLPFLRQTKKGIVKILIFSRRV